MMQRWMIAVGAAIALAGCETAKDVAAKTEPLNTNVIDEANLNGLMLTVGDPNDGVEYFRRAMAEDPSRVDFKVGFARSLARAQRYKDAATVFGELQKDGALSEEDKVEYAVVLSRLERWDDVETELVSLSSSFESARRYTVAGMLYDQRQDWVMADAAYGRAMELTTTPGRILNNWGVSQMSRGDLPGAIQTFEQVVYLEPTMFDAKNNLVIARGLTGDYRLPSVSMSETERAKLQHNLALIALRRGDVEVAKGLLRAALDTHPLYYAQAAEKLKALEALDR